MTPQERKALKLALECAERCESIDGMYSWADTITAIKEALAQPEHEPVGEAYLCDLCHTPFDGAFQCPSCGHVRATKEPVYTTPPQRKPPTDEQQQAMRLYKAVERLALQAGEETDETVDWLCGQHGGMSKLFLDYFSPKVSNSEPLANQLANQPETSGSPVQQEPVALDVTIEGDNAKLLAAMLGSDSDGEATAIRLLVGSGHSGYGLYVADNEYPDEGSTLLVNTSKEPCSECKGLGYYDEGHENDDGTMSGGNYVECNKCKPA